MRAFETSFENVIYRFTLMMAVVMYTSVKKNLIFSEEILGFLQ